MDAAFQSTRHDPIVVTGAAHVLGTPDPTPYLKVRKNRKFMGVQDDLAVTAAGRALEMAGYAGEPLGTRAGLYIAVGYIPFEKTHVDLLLENSLDASGEVSMQRFSTDAFDALNPLLTFRCLSNMPAFHVSVNFNLQGPYVVTYPGPGQFYLALEEAAAALVSRRVDVALVGGVAHQRNFLVEHHFRRVEPPIEAHDLRDASACLVLERGSSARDWARARLIDWEIDYRPHHPFEEPSAHLPLGVGPQRPIHEKSQALREEAKGVAAHEGTLNTASLPAWVSLNLGSPLRHELESRDGIVAWSEWGSP